MLTEGAKHVLGWRSPGFMYTNAINPKLKLLLKNFRLSDDIAFRFSQQSWSEWPLTTEKFVAWLNQLDPKEETVNLFMDYETFGEHQWSETGIFDFMRALPGRVFADSDYVFATPSELGEKLQPVGSIHVPHPISWADEERDLTAWLGNELQDEAFEKLYALEPLVKNSDNPDIQRDWLYMQTSDHFYYMCTKWFSDGDVHKYFNPYGTPYEAFINYMNVLSDFIIRLEKESGSNKENFKNMKGSFEDFMDQTEEYVKKKVEKTKKSAKKILKDKDIDLDSIRKMSNAKIKELLKDVDIEELSGALKGAGKEITEKIIPNLGKRAQKEFDKAQKKMDEISSEDIEEYRKKIEEKLKKFFKKK
jgi:alpha-amylase